MRWISVASIACGLLIVGCGPKFEETTIDGLRVVTADLKSKGNGQAKFKLPVNEGETSFLATVEVESPYHTHFQYLDAPGGENLFDWEEETLGDHSKTNAGYIAETVNLNWPVLDSDPALAEGKYKIAFNVVEGREFVASPIRLSVALKADDDLTSGVLNVAIVYAGGTDEDEGVVAAVESALDHWIELYAEIGVDLAFTTATYEDGDLDPPAFGTDDAFVEIAEMTGFREVSVVIAPDINALDDVFGIAGDIPGPLVATRRSGILVSASQSAGTDGEFDAVDVRVLGETLAHETGHYLGLFHPVEVTFDTWDALSDTPECDGEFNCVEAMEDFLMFPFPVCGLVACTPQDVVTDEQGAVVNRHVAIE